jgi:uncharacterized coiled-coil protein SlyX
MPEDAIVKDPTKKRFWTPKNVGAYILIALLPVAGTWAWNALTNAWSTMKRMDERLKVLEGDQANNRAIWDAITENKNETARQREDLRVMQRLFDREFERSTAPKASEPPKREEPKPPPVDPEKLRTMMEQRYPQKK